MILRNLFAILFVFLLCLSCGSSKKSEAPPVEQPAGPPPSGLARGILHAVVIVTQSAKTDSMTVCEVRVENILGRGPNTPSLPVGSILSLNVTPRLSAGKDMDSALKEGTELEVYLGFAQVFQGEEGGEWRLVKWIK